MSAILNFADRHGFTDGASTKLITATGRATSAEEALKLAHANLVKERYRLDDTHKQGVYLNDHVMVVSQQFFNEVLVTLAQEWVER